MSTANRIVHPLPEPGGGRVGGGLSVRAAHGGVVGGDHHQPVPGGRPCAEFEHDDPARLDAALHERVARLLGRAHRARDPAGEVDRDDVVAALEQRLVDGEEVADRRLRRARQVAAALAGTS